MYVSMYVYCLFIVCMYVCMNVGIMAFMYVCMYVCMYGRGVYNQCSTLTTAEAMFWTKLSKLGVVEVE